MKKIFLLTILTVSTIVLAQQKPIVFDGFAQGTTYHITYFDKKDRFLKNDIDHLLAKFDLSVSTYNKNSIISKINTNEKNVKLDKYFISCFNKAKEVWKNTNGAFDPTVYPLSNIWGFGPGEKEKVNQQKIDSILKFVGLNLISIKGNKIIKKDARVKLDFNAFAQGYSVDVVSDYLKSKGITNFIVEIGGEVYANGKNKNRNEYWKIGIEKPFDNKDSENPLKSIAKIENMAIATSGNYRRFFIEDGVKYSHHIDPKTGYPTKNNLLSASVFSKQCINSDATATGILVMGLEKAKLYFKQHPEIEGYLIYSDEKGNLQVFETPGLKSIIEEVKE